MFPFGIRIWNGKQMLYPVKFTMQLNSVQDKGILTATVERKKYTTKDIMLLTPGIAVNGKIYEKDIVTFADGKTGIVEFDDEDGIFVVSINNKNKVAVSKKMPLCEIIGNLLETSDLVGRESSSETDVVVDNVPDEELMESHSETDEPNEPQKIVIQEEDIKEVTEYPTEEDIEPMPSETDNNIDEVVVDDTPINDEDTFDEDDDEKPEIVLSANNITAIISTLCPNDDEKPRDAESGIGTLCFALKDDETRKIEYVQDVTDKTSLSELELMAAIQILQTTPLNCNLKIYSRSQHLVFPFIKGWINKWQANNWKKDNGEDLKNKSTLQKLFSLTQNRKIEWFCLKGNESPIADECFKRAKALYDSVV